MVWKTAQKKAKQKKTIRLALLCLAAILLLLLTGQIFKMGNLLFSPINGTEKRTYYWDGTFNLNLVALSEPLGVISYNPKEQSLKILEIPDETYLEVPGGFGSWRTGAIFKLGEAEHPPKGAKLLKGSVENFLAVPMDGFMEIRGPASRGEQGVSSEQLVDLLRGNPLAFIANLRTDLTPLELIRFYWGIRGVRFDKVFTFNLADLGLLRSSSLADGTPVLVGDPAKIDALVSRNFTENKLVEEAATIGVFNATDKPGLASKTAQIISHLGGNVIIQTSLGNKLGHNAISGGPNYPYTTKRLKEIFAPNCEREKNCDILGAAAVAGDFARASVNLILGQ